MVLPQVKENGRLRIYAADRVQMNCSPEDARFLVSKILEVNAKLLAAQNYASLEAVRAEILGGLAEPKARLARYLSAHLGKPVAGKDLQDLSVILKPTSGVIRIDVAHAVAKEDKIIVHNYEVVLSTGHEMLSRKLMNIHLKKHPSESYSDVAQKVDCALQGI